jgi:hypothetical protein
MAAAYGTGSETGMQAEMESNSEDPSRLLVVWTSGDREVALKMVFMYTFNAKRLAWWDTVRLLPLC